MSNSLPLPQTIDRAKAAIVSRHAGSASLVCLLQDCFTVPEVSPSDSTAVSVRMEARGSHVPANNTLTAVATYALPSGKPRTAVLTVSAAQRHCCQANWCMQLHRLTRLALSCIKFSSTQR